MAQQEQGHSNRCSFYNRIVLDSESECEELDDEDEEFDEDCETSEEEWDSDEMYSSDED